MNLDLAGGNTQGPTSWKRPFPSGKRGIKLGKEKKNNYAFIQTRMSIHSHVHTDTQTRKTRKKRPAYTRTQVRRQTRKHKHKNADNFLYKLSHGHTQISTHRQKNRYTYKNRVSNSQKSVTYQYTVVKYKDSHRYKIIHSSIQPDAYQHRHTHIHTLMYVLVNLEYQFLIRFKEKNR